MKPLTRDPIINHHADLYIAYGNMSLFFLSPGKARTMTHLEDPKSNPESRVGSSCSTSCLLSPTGFEDENGVEVPNRFDFDSSLIRSSAPMGSTVKSS